MTVLTVELVPRTCWYSNVRSNVSAKDWKTCKDFVRERSNDRCEICGGQGRRWPVECHETWDYDDKTYVQRLTGLIALCPACHEVKHLGRAEATGRLNAALAHLSKVNEWSRLEAHTYARSVFDQWVLRSQHSWTLDISYLVEVLGP